jgi:hypothetical protein
LPPTPKPTSEPTPAPTEFTYLCDADDWTLVKGTWEWDGCVVEQSAETSSAVAALSDYVFADFTLNVTMECSSGIGSMGMLFRASNFSGAAFGGNSYFVGFSPDTNALSLGVLDNGWTQLKAADLDFATGREYILRVEAYGSDIKIFLDNTLELHAEDSTYDTGHLGMRLYQTAGYYSDLHIEAAPTPAPTTSTPTPEPTSQPTPVPTHAPTIAPTVDCDDVDDFSSQPSELEVVAGLCVYVRVSRTRSATCPSPV